MSQKKFDTIYADLRRQLLNGELPSGSIFTETQWALRYGVARDTLRRATDLLADAGLLCRLHGRGVMVSNPAVETRNILTVTAPNESTYSQLPFLHQQLCALAPEANIRLKSCSMQSLLKLSRPEIKRQMQTHHIAGILLSGNAFTGKEPILQHLKFLKIPIVLLLCNEEDSRITNWSAIGYDYHTGWAIGLRYLSQCGHRRILTVGGNADEIRGYSLKEYQTLLRSNQLDPDLRFYLPFRVRQLTSEADSLFAELLKNDPPPTAIMCYSSFHAVQVYEILRRLGKKIPEEVSVIGFCACVDVEAMSPPLSTVEVELADIARQGLKLIRTAANWYRNDDSELRVPYFQLRPRMIVRGSSRSIKK